MDGAGDEAEGGGGAFGDAGDGGLGVRGEAGGGDVDGFFKEGAVEGVGFVEEGEDVEFAVVHEAFEGDFDAGDEVFDEEFVTGFGGEEGTEAGEAGEEFGGVVCAHDAAAPREGGGFDDAGVAGTGGDGGEVFVQEVVMKVWGGDTGLGEFLPHEVFVAGGEGGFGGVVGEVNPFAGGGGDEGAGIVEAEDRAEGGGLGVLLDEFGGAGDVAVVYGQRAVDFADEGRGDVLAAKDGDAQAGGGVFKGFGPVGEGGGEEEEGFFRHGGSAQV